MRPVRGVDQRRQRVGIGRLELGERPVLDDLGGQLVAEGELLEHVGVGRVAGLGLPERRQLELLEQDGGELLGRADVELAAREHVDVPGRPLERQLELARELVEALLVDADAVALHVGEDGDERPLDGFVELEEPDFSERPRGHRPQLPDPSRAAARRREARPLAEQLARHFLQPVVGLRRIEQIGDEGGILDRRRRAAAADPPLDQMLGVMPDQRPPAEVGKRVAPGRRHRRRAWRRPPPDERGRAPPASDREGRPRPPTRRRSRHPRGFSRDRPRAPRGRRAPARPRRPTAAAGADGSWRSKLVNSSSVQSARSLSQSGS